MPNQQTSTRVAPSTWREIRTSYVRPVTGYIALGTVWLAYTAIAKTPPTGILLDTWTIAAVLPQLSLYRTASRRLRHAGVLRTAAGALICLLGGLAAMYLGTLAGFGLMLILLVPVFEPRLTEITTSYLACAQFVASLRPRRRHDLAKRASGHHHGLFFSTEARWLEDSLS